MPYELWVILGTLEGGCLLAICRCSLEPPSYGWRVETGTLPAMERLGCHICRWVPATMGAWNLPWVRVRDARRGTMRNIALNALWWTARVRAFTGCRSRRCGSPAHDPNALRAPDTNAWVERRHARCRGCAPRLRARVSRARGLSLTGTGTSGFGASLAERAWILLYLEPACSWVAPYLEQTDKCLVGCLPAAASARLLMPGHGL